ncbi:MAG: NADH-quinone oxidoreductase subunit H [Candidatus Brocadiia bacterium]
MNGYSLINIFLALICAPFLLSIINRVKAFWAGRHGQPLLQPYYDLIKLLQKESVYSRTTTWVFAAGPVGGLAIALLLITLIPLAGIPALFSFRGDIFLLIYLLALLRFLTIISALDTGSSFEGMGASRESFFSAMAEPAFAIGLIALVKMTGQTSLSGCFTHFSFALWNDISAPLLLVLSAWVIVFLVENARIPIDDPNTHLELTMIHEVMVLDHSGPDFAFIQYTSSLKMWVLGMLLINVLVPFHTGKIIIDLLIAIGSLFLLATLIGIIESVMARLRLVRIPQLLIVAGTFSILAFILIIRSQIT